MARYRLLGGQHVMADTSKPKYQVAGSNPPSFRYPTITFKAGDVVETDLDLVARFGANKFQLLGRPEDEPAPISDPPAKPGKAAK